MIIMPRDDYCCPLSIVQANDNALGYVLLVSKTRNLQLHAGRAQKIIYLALYQVLRTVRTTVQGPTVQYSTRKLAERHAMDIG